LRPGTLGDAHWSTQRNATLPRSGAEKQ
jgi:hypothetical protein